MNNYSIFGEYNQDFHDFFDKLSEEIKYIDNYLKLNLFDFHFYEWYQNYHNSLSKFENEFKLKIDPKTIYLVVEIGCEANERWINISEEECQNIAKRTKKLIENFAEDYFKPNNILSNFRKNKVKVLTRIYDLE